MRRSAAAFYPDRCQAVAVSRGYRASNDGLIRRRIPPMTIEDLEAAALKLDPKSRARLAERLLESLDELTPDENARIWAEEAQRRVEALDAGTLSSRPASDVFRDARARI